MSLMGDIRRKSQEEVEAHHSYSRMAMRARKEGKDYTASVLESIASDELQHAAMLADMKVRPEGVLFPTPAYVEIVDSGSTTFGIGDTVSWASFEQENERVRGFGGKPAWSRALL